MAFVSFLIFHSSPAFADFIIDNGNPGTSSTGTWSVSGGTQPYGANSLWARNGATYTWQFTPQPTGLYEVYMWWSGQSNRPDRAEVRINHRDGRETLYVNQKQNAGQWNKLGGQYSFTTSGSVTIVAAPSTSTNITSTCADAVKFVPISGPSQPPTAAFSATPTSGYTPLAVQFTDQSQGAPTGWAWDFNNDGTTDSNAQNPSHTYSTEGTYTVKLTVTNSDGSDEELKTGYITVSKSTQNATEHIYYIGRLYNAQADAITPFINTIEAVGARKVDDVWKYTNTVQNKEYIIHIVENLAGYEQALQTEGAHIILSAHSNYGAGALQAPENQTTIEPIYEVKYVDDELFFHGTTPFFGINLRGARTTHGTPNYWCERRDGSSAQMPYTFDNPQDPPPYNYYLSYRVPGDPTYYRAEGVHKGAMQRFPGSAEPWFSSVGAKPNPTNPDHRKYFITNYKPWTPSVTATDGWMGSKTLPSTTYWNENYDYALAGTGSEQFQWLFKVPKDGYYRIYARWPQSSTHTTSANFLVNHSGGTASLTADQTRNGAVWRGLGSTYYFNADQTDIQDWYESRYDEPQLLTLDQSNIGGNATKKAKFTGSLYGNAYLTQPFSSVQEGTFSLNWKIYMDSILDDANRDRGGMMLVGTDTGSGPNQGSGSCIQMAFWAPGGGSSGSNMSLIAREPGDSSTDSSQWKLVASGLSFDNWHDIQVDINVANATYNVWVDNVLMATGVQFYTQQSALTHISFAQWNDGAGTFHIDDVESSIPDLLVDGDFEDSQSSEALRANTGTGEGNSGSVVLTNKAPGGRVVADAVRIVDADSPPIVQAEFYAYARYGTVPLTVEFVGQSTGEATGDVVTRQWDFGDGGTSRYRDPTHTYTKPGLYTVTLTVTGPAGSSTKQKVGYIRVDQTAAAPPVQAEFSATNQSGAAGHTVSFRDRSTGATSLRWDFGDNTFSTLSQPNHTYTKPGVYTVKLTINGNVTITKQNFVRVYTFDKIMDNVDYPLTHYGSWTILRAMNGSTPQPGLNHVPQEKLRYARMAYFSCTSGPYYAGYYNRGVMFFTVSTAETWYYIIYIDAYLKGKSDEEIWELLNDRAALFDYYNFNLKPNEQ